MGTLCVRVKRRKFVETRAIAILLRMFCRSAVINNKLVDSSTTLFGAVTGLKCGSMKPIYFLLFLLLVGHGSCKEADNDTFEATNEWQPIREGRSCF